MYDDTQVRATSAAAPAGPGAPTRPTLTRMVWAGRGISGFAAIFLLFDGMARMARFEPYVEGLTQFGYPERLGVWIGLALVVSTLLYLLPRTAALGAILLTGYLGGATATHVRVEDPWFLFAVGFGVLVWVGLALRDPRVLDLISPRPGR